MAPKKIKSKSVSKGKSLGTSRIKGRRWTHELTVVGLGFRMKRDVRRAFYDMVEKRGSIGGCMLRREPDNPADEDAIAVFLPIRLGALHLGYLTREVAAVLAPKLDSGATQVVSAKIERITGESDDYKAATMIVTFADRAKRPVRKPKTS